MAPDGPAPPPSKDDPNKPAPKSERVKSTRSSGGQLGHKGHTLEMSLTPDEVIQFPLSGHCACGHSWGEVPVDQYFARQIHDLPEPRLHVTEYQVEVKTCPCCAQQQQADFPLNVLGQVQYGPRVYALTVYLNTAHFIPLERTAEILGSVYRAKLSDGTIVSALERGYNTLEGFERQLKTALMNQSVLHTDETGCKVSGKNHWIHVVSSAKLVYYGFHTGRGQEAIRDMNILTEYSGYLVHDFWQPYLALPAKHVFCNAHLLREYRNLAERHGQPWAGELRTALREVYHQHKEGTLTLEGKARFYTAFNALVSRALLENPEQIKVLGEGGKYKKGSAKQTKGRNLALRCQKHSLEMLSFLEDPQVPFDNNPAEQNIRMVCIKRKVSGGFRTVKGGEIFCRIRSYIATLRKQGLSVWGGLVSLFQGDVLMPDFSC